MKQIGLARMIDIENGGTLCRVRLLDDEGLPRGKVLTGVKYLPNANPVNIKPLPKLPEEEIDTIARQNIMYNSYMEVEIV